MTDKHKPSPEDVALFRAAVKRVKRLRREKTVPHAARPRPVPRQTLADEARVRDEMLSDGFDPADVETGDELLYAGPGVQHGTLRKLRRGQFSIRAELDLHGRTVPEARAALREFLADCQTRGQRCVRIIHGKGHGSPGRQPVLKVRVNAWLQQHGAVLAFCSARPADGGTGAVYVLLRKP